MRISWLRDIYGIFSGHVKKSTMLKQFVAIFAILGLGHAIPLAAETSCTEGLAVDPTNDCSSTYLQCDNGIYKERQCGAGTKFNPAVGYCDWESNIEACRTDSTTTTEATTTTTTTTVAAEVEEETCTNDALITPPDTPCSGTYLQCDNGVYVERSCPAGLKFNQNAGQCDYDYNVAACGTSGESDSTTTTTTTASTTTIEAEEETCDEEFTVDPTNPCSGIFFQCANGVYVEQQCPADTKFDIESERCDYGYNVAACQTDSTTTVTPATTVKAEEAPSGGSCNHAELIKKSECSGNFYQCVHGTKVELSCPGDLIFNGVQCDYESEVEGCDSPDIKRRVCEHGWLKLKCRRSKVIKVRSASYGRSDPDVCKHPRIEDTNCRADSSEFIVAGWCDGRSRCVLPASNLLFGDPCFGTYKYLEVEYDCV